MSLRPRIAMRPARCRRAISLETDSRVEATMHERSRCVRRTPTAVPPSVFLPEALRQLRQQAGEPVVHLPRQQPLDGRLSLLGPLRHGGYRTPWRSPGRA